MVAIAAFAIRKTWRLNDDTGIFGSQSAPKFAGRHLQRAFHRGCGLDLLADGSDQGLALCPGLYLGLRAGISQRDRDLAGDRPEQVCIILG